MEIIMIIISILIYKQSCKTNNSGYSIKNNTNKIFALKESETTGLSFDLNRFNNHSHYNFLNVISSSNYYLIATSNCSVES